MSELEPYRPERALQPGYILDGEYVVDRVLGSGGFAITYLAHPRRLPSKRIAIKEYFPKNHAERLANGQVSMDHGSSQSAQICDWGLARFRDEGNNVYEIANERVRHPNIVLVERIFDANNTTYMVMEYVEGDTLEATIHQAIEAGQYLSEEWLRGFLGRMLNALEVIHAARKLHRDIKPSNIIITKAPDGSPQPVLIDFGSARDDLREISSAGDTTNHTIVVSPGYAPIEQERGGTQGAFTDLYGLAATAYHATFLEKPVSSTVRWNAMQVERADGAYEIDLSRDPLRSALNKGKGRFSNAYLAFLDRGLAIEPKRRPASAAQWRTQFGVIEPPPPRPRAKLLSLPWAAGLAVCIVIGAGVGWHYLHSNAPSTKINAALETLALGPTARSHVNEALSNFSAAAAQEPANQVAQAGARGCSSLLDFIGALQTNDLERAQIAYNVATQALIQAGASEALIDEAAKPLTRLRHEAALLSRLSAAGLDPARLRDLRGNEQELAILYGAGAAQRFSELRKSLEDAASAVAGNEFSRARDLVRNSVVGLSDYPAEFSDRAAATSALRAASASWANSELQALRNRLLGTVDYDQLNESAAGLQIVANQAADDPQADEITALRALVQALSQTRDDDAQTPIITPAMAASAAADLRHARLPSEWLDRQTKRLRAERYYDQTVLLGQRLGDTPFSAATLGRIKEAATEVLALSEQETKHTAHARALLLVVDNFRDAMAHVARAQYAQAMSKVEAATKALDAAQLPASVGQQARLALNTETAKSTETLLDEARAILASRTGFTRRIEALHLYRRVLTQSPNDRRAALGAQSVEILDLITQARSDDELVLAWQLKGSLRAALSRLEIGGTLLNDVQAKLDSLTKSRSRQVFTQALVDALSAPAAFGPRSVAPIRHAVDRSNELIALVNQPLLAREYGAYKTGVRAIEVAAAKHRLGDRDAAGRALRDARRMLREVAELANPVLLRYEAEIQRPFIDPDIAPSPTLSPRRVVHLLEQAVRKMGARRFAGASADLAILRRAEPSFTPTMRAESLTAIDAAEERLRTEEHAALAQASSWLRKARQTLEDDPRSATNRDTAQLYVRRVLRDIYVDLPKARAAEETIESLQTAFQAFGDSRPDAARRALVHATARAKAWLNEVPQFMAELNSSLTQ